MHYLSKLSMQHDMYSFYHFIISNYELHQPPVLQTRHMKPSKRDINSRISSLIKSTSILSTCQSDQQADYCIEAYDPIQMAENSLVGKIVGGVVVSKNQSAKELCVHLTVYYDHSKKVQISANRYVAFIKDYELKADLSIFGYLNNFKDIDTGTFINAWVRRIQKRQNKTHFELHLNRPTDAKNLFVKLGVVKDNIKVPESVQKVYKKQETLPLNFLILYETNYDNPGLQSTFLKSLKVEQHGSIHRVSNVAALRRLDYNFNRIRQTQQRSWRDEHLELGLECMKDAQYQAAIECFNISLKFDSEFVDTHIAKACAYVNMNNFSDGVKSIKEALKLEPHNPRAQKYYQQFQKQLSVKSIEQPNFKKKSWNSDYKLVFHK